MRTKVLVATSALALLLSAAIPLPAAQPAQAKKQEAAAASAQQPTSGSVPLRVGLVISDAVRSYKTMIFLTRIEFGRRLSEKAEKIFNETFASVRQMTELPAGPHGYDDLDLVVVVEVADAHTQTPFLGTPTYFLTARFTVRGANGEQIFQTQETDSEQSRSPAEGPDHAGEAVVRKFIQELVLNPRVRAILSPPPAAPVETQPVLADTSMMDSAGLDVPPPPPWAQQAAGSPAPAPSGPGSSGRP